MKTSTYHKTELARTASAQPAALVSKDAHAIVKLAWESEALQDWLKDVSDTFFSSEDWKAPFQAHMPLDAEGNTIHASVGAAVIWYHGAQPYVDNYNVTSPGYSC